MDDMRTVLRVLTSPDARADSEPIAVSDQVLSVEIENGMLTLEPQGFHVPKDINGDVPVIPRAIQAGLAPVVREPITNILKHASRGTDRTVTLQVLGSREKIQWVVSNAIAEPTEGNAALKGGFGLIGLRERMQLLGGTLSAGVEGGVWTVTAPLYKNATAAKPDLLDAHAS